MAKRKYKRNPVPRGRLAKTETAIKLYQRFRNQDPAFVDEYSAPDMSVCMLIGKCDAIEYTTIRDGKKELYRHEFTGNPGQAN